MTGLSLDATVGRWVTEHPQTARVLEAHRIDYCCRGDKSLESACREQGLDLIHVLLQLRQAINKQGARTQQDWSEASCTELCDDIEKTHHAYLRTEVPRLTELVAKVVEAHQARHPELTQVQHALAALRAELEPHMFKEEQVLFPAIRQLEQSEHLPAFPFGTLANPIRMMQHEHDNAGDALARIRELTDDFRGPADACNTYRALLDALARLERDLHQHVHKENNILFPTALRREAQLAAAQPR